MKHLIIVLTLALISTSSYGQSKDSTMIFDLKNSVILKETLFDDFSHIESYTPKNIKAKFQPELIIHFESQIGITIKARIKKANAIAPTLCSFDSYMIDPIYGDQSTKCFLQIGEHDFDKDGVAEIVIAFGVRGTYLKCKIFQYHEPANIADADREENWTLVGDFDEYGYHDTRYVSTVEDNKIFFPFGSQGASEGFVFVEGKFVKFQ